MLKIKEKRQNMKQEYLYPNMELICRLCLKENTATVSVFPEQQQNDTGNQTNMSIPMRIMACVALEVQTNDGLPKNICTECRYQLEKSYLFRKQSQASDAKLRKHIRLLSLGKSSRVFQKKTDEDDDDDGIEFYDSIEFIKQHDEKNQMEEQVKLKNLEAQIKAEHESELEKSKEMLKIKCKEELRAEVEERVKQELRQQIQEEYERDIIPSIRMECMQEAKQSVRDEVKDECRQIEMRALLDDLQLYLKEKQKPCAPLDPLAEEVVITQKILQLNTNNQDENTGAEKRRYSEIITRAQDAPAISTKRIKYHVSRKQAPPNVKSELILSDNQSDMDTNVNEEDGDSDNFLIYDTDEGFEIQKKNDAGTGDEDEDTFTEDHLQTYESSEEHMDVNSSQEDPKASTISYRSKLYLKSILLSLFMQLYY